MSRKIKIAFTIAIALNVVMAVAQICLGEWLCFWLNASTAIFVWLIYRQAKIISKLIEENFQLECKLEYERALNGYVNGINTLNALEYAERPDVNHAPQHNS